MSKILTSDEIKTKLKKKYNSKLVEYYFNGDSHSKTNNPTENFNENDEGDQIFAKEKSFVSKIIENQSHFFLTLQNILDFVTFKTDNIIQTVL